MNHLFARFFVFVFFLLASSTALAQAFFEVHKVFSDGANQPVEIQILCNTGLPVSQFATITPPDYLEFVVTDFDSGELRCQITETVPAGYVASYNDGSTTSSDWCEFDDVVDGASLRCDITNSLRPDRVEIEVNKTFVDGPNAPVEVTLTCNTGLPLQQIVTFTPPDFINFVVTDFDNGTMDCAVTEDVPAGYSPNYNDGSSDSPVECRFEDISWGDSLSCDITNTRMRRATFNITKEYPDGSLTPVEVTLICNTGLPLLQSAFINPASGATFVVTDFADGLLDCELTETIPAGYAPEYDDGTLSAINCEWTSVMWGDVHSCNVTNIPTDLDSDADGVLNIADNCPAQANSAQADADGDKEGDACDPDDDNDAAPDEQDNCPWVENPNQEDADGNGVGDACEGDLDGDGIGDANDNCPNSPNASQNDHDGDGDGDACDPDVDDDGVANGADQCEQTNDLVVFDIDSGCSIGQLCPCEGPKGRDIPWADHDEYVDCVKFVAKAFKQLGIITKEEKKALKKAAKQSSCGE